MTEKDYGLVPERISWGQPIDGERSMQVAGCHVGHAADVPAGGPQVLARTENLAMYVRTFGEGGGEDGLHHHDDDALWFVLRGRATFRSRDGVLLGDLGAHEGVVVPCGTSYRFVCTEPATLARVAARASTTL
jgi:mannose-6-phosphate isomerase-like protein (cupin superfamily)